MFRNASKFLILAAAFSAVASADATAAGLIERIKGGGKVVLAYRESSVPFSFMDTASKKPMGYALDMCRKIVDAAGAKAGVKNVPVDYLQVTSANRIEVIEQGKADMECGSTTNNAERRTKVAFTVPHFIAGARLLVQANSTVEKMEDLKGKKLVSTQGTTPLKVAEAANRERSMGITILQAPDHARAVEMVANGEADAFLMDDVLLFGLNANRPNPNQLKVVGKYLTTEPLAIMFSKNDPELKKVALGEMRRLIASQEVYAIYDKWFIKPIPPRNTALNLPRGYLLKDFWKYPTDVVPF